MISICICRQINTFATKNLWTIIYIRGYRISIQCHNYLFDICWWGNRISHSIFLRKSWLFTRPHNINLNLIICHRLSIWTIILRFRHKEVQSWSSSGLLYLFSQILFDIFQIHIIWHKWSWRNKISFFNLISRSKRTHLSETWSIYFYLRNWSFCFLWQ